MNQAPADAGARPPGVAKRAVVSSRIIVRRAGKRMHPTGCEYGCQRSLLSPMSTW